MPDFPVSVIIPCYNEEQTVGNIVEELKQQFPEYEILVVDDGSNDQTADIAKKAGAIVYRHPVNIGNGAAVKSGIRNASGDIFVFMDADGQHDPKDIPKMLSYFPDYDMVVGARTLDGQASVLRAMGNTFYNRLASYVASFNVKDLTSGFRAVKAEIAKGFLYMLPNAYSYPTTITLGALRSGFGVKYFPIKARKRSAGTSNIKLIRDGLRFFIIIIKICTLFSPFRIFLPVSIGMTAIGLSYYFYTFVTSGRFTNMSALLFTSAITIFMMGLISEQICQLRFERRSGSRKARLVNHGASAVKSDDRSDNSSSDLL